MQKPCHYERLEPELFNKIVSVLRNGITQQRINVALHLWLEICSWVEIKSL